MKRKEIDMNLYVVKKFFELCKKLGSPSGKERNLVNLVEELFATFKTSRVIYFLRLSFLEFMKGNNKHKEFVIKMVRDLEIKTK